jgi:hypothetical protein
MHLMVMHVCLWTQICMYVRMHTRTHNHYATVSSYACKHVATHVYTAYK